MIIEIYLLKGHEFLAEKRLNLDPAREYVNKVTEAMVEAANKKRN